LLSNRAGRRDCESQKYHKGDQEVWVRNLKMTEAEKLFNETFAQWLEVGATRSEKWPPLD